MKNGLTKLQKEMYPVMEGQCLCARQITELITIERTDIGDNRPLLKSTVVSTIRKLAAYGYIKRQPGSDELQSVYYKVLARYTQEMTAPDEKSDVVTIKPVFISASMDLLGKTWSQLGSQKWLEKRMLS